MCTPRFLQKDHLTFSSFYDCTAIIELDRDRGSVLVVGFGDKKKIFSKNSLGLVVRY